MILKFNQKQYISPKEFEHIMFGHLGNGITVWDKSKKDDNNFDYVKLAHIDKNRVVTFYNDDISKDEIEYIKGYAKKENPRVSSTQAQYVFTSVAILKNYYFVYGIGHKYEDKYTVIQAYTDHDANELRKLRLDNSRIIQYNEKEWFFSDGTTLGDKYNLTELEI